MVDPRVERSRGAGVGVGVGGAWVVAQAWKAAMVAAAEEEKGNARGRVGQVERARGGRGARHYLKMGPFSPF
jgi:hypothetical protein